MSDTAAPAFRSVILSGGFGTRLWPLSRESHPKQFQALVGERSLLQDTAARLRGLALVAPDPSPILVCHAEHRFLAAEQLREAGEVVPTILLEPEGRNTAPALTLACLEAVREGLDPVLLVMPSDHAIADRDALARAVATACRFAADKDSVVTFGIVPDRPETGYGYIRRGEPLAAGLYRTAGFVEKPDLAGATAFMQAGGYFWNSGMFLMRASVWLRAIGHCRPDILGPCQLAMQGATRDLDFIRPDPVPFSVCPGDSIDYAVMERLPQLPALGIEACVVELRAGWSDVGSWDALGFLLARDANGNAVKGDVVARDSSDNLLFSTGRLLAAVGLRNLAVVETPDAVLVLPLDRAQEVKQLVADLKTGGRHPAETHRKVHRPWGWYDSLDRGERFQVKRIVVKPGASLSLQLHHHRAEHWVVVHGIARVTRGDQVYDLGENESTYIPQGTRHRLTNPGAAPLEIIEIQSGSYLGEDDIVRFEDAYGRPTPAAAGDPLA